MMILSNIECSFGGSGNDENFATEARLNGEKGRRRGGTRKDEEKVNERERSEGGVKGGEGRGAGTVFRRTSLASAHNRRVGSRAPAAYLLDRGISSRDARINRFSAPLTRERESDNRKRKKEAQERHGRGRETQGQGETTQHIS